jgi:predicted RNA-binding Zn ribbon-like protein
MNIGMSREANPQLVVDFVNTVDWRADAERRAELLPDFEALVRWSQTHAVLSDAIARKVLRRGREHSRVAGQVLDRARRLRDAIYQVLSALAAGGKVAQADLDAIADESTKLADRVHFTQSKKIVGWEWSGDEDDVERLLWPPLLAATELLTSDTLSRVRECEGPGCGWIILDQTKNRSRRWCSMETCGNRAKGRRFYERHKEEMAR